MNYPQIIWTILVLVLVIGVWASGITKRSRAYFRARELQSVVRRGPRYDIKQAAQSVAQHLAVPRATNLSDLQIEEILTARDQYLDSDDAYVLGVGPMAEDSRSVKTIAKRLAAKGNEVSVDDIVAVLDAEIHYLKKVGLVKD